jgi:PAS domain S-box-containing protein
MTETQPPEPSVFRTASVSFEESLELFGPEELASRLRALQRVTDAALAHLQLDALLEALLERVRETLGVDVVRVLLCSPAGTELSVRASLGLDDEGDAGASVPIPLGQGVAGWVAYHKTGMIIDDLSKVGVVHEVLHRLGSAMVTPMLVEGSLIGVLKVATAERRSFADADLALLQMVADRIALAVDRARQFEAARSAERDRGREEHWYRSLFDNNPAAVFALDPEGRFTSLNPAAERISGYRAEELLGHPFVPLIVEEDGERVLRAFHSAQRGEAQNLTFGLETRAGGQVQLQVTAVPITLEGEVAGVYGIAEDVTEKIDRHRESERLIDEVRTERAQLEAVLQQMPAGVLIAEAASGRVIRANTRAVELLGHPVERADDGEPYSEWSGSWPDGTAIRPREWPLARALESGEVISGEEVLYSRGDGTRRWLRINAAPIRDPDGRVVAGVAVMYDIHEQKKAVDELRFLADVGGALHTTLDHRDTLRQVARLAVPRFADWCVVDLVDAHGRPYRQDAAHHDPARELLVRELQRTHPARLDREDHPIGQAIRSGEPILIPEISEELLRRLAHDDEHLEAARALGLVSAIIVPLRGHHRVLGAISFAAAESGHVYDEHDLALAQEIARRSSLAIENADLFAAASEANRAKADFLAVMSHELRTPLAAIMGYAELLQMGIPIPIPEDAVRQVERIDAAARHQLQLIEEILTFSRLSAGEEVVRPERVDVAASIRDAVDFIRPAAERKGLTLRMELPEPGCEIESDASKVRQVLVNLLFNAVQFTRAGTIEIRLTAEPNEVLIAVRDTGIGIAEEHLRKIFDPFWQVRQSSTREVGGTGLGLTVAQRIAEILGGRIAVLSELDRGSTFTVRLPTAPP